MRLIAGRGETFLEKVFPHTPSKNFFSACCARYGFILATFQTHTPAFLHAEQRGFNGHRLLQKSNSDMVTVSESLILIKQTKQPR